MKNKKKIIVLMLCLIGMNVQLPAHQVLKINGEEAQKVPVEIVQEGNMLTIAYSDGTSVDVAMNQVEVFFNSTTGINTHSMQFFSLEKSVGDELTINGLVGNETISLYSVKGILLKQKSITGKSVTLDLGNVPDDIYILKINRQSIKFAKKR